MLSAEWATDRDVNRVRLNVPRGELMELANAIKSLSDQDPNYALRRQALNFASVHDSAVAAGNTDLTKAGSVEEMVGMLVEGVHGEGSFSTGRFSVPYSSDKAGLKAIARCLKRDNDRLLLRPARNSQGANPISGFATRKRP